MNAPSSVTIASSIALRLRCLAPRLHGLGARPLYEAMAEIFGGADPMTTFGRYAALTLCADFIEANGGRDLPATIRVVK